jgi:hypothetical protein
MLWLVVDDITIILWWWWRVGQWMECGGCVLSRVKLTDLGTAWREGRADGAPADPSPFQSIVCPNLYQGIIITKRFLEFKFDLNWVIQIQI